MGAFGEAGVRTDAGGVVEIVEHGRAHGGGNEQGFEAAEGEGPDDVALVSGYVIGRILRLLRVDIEVVEPEVGHDLVELALSVEVAEEFGLEQLGIDEGGRTIEGDDVLQLLRGEALHETGALGGRAQLLAERAQLLRRE